jgi:CheY-like chemotaxis protein
LNIELDLHSAPGAGTCFNLRMPMMQQIVHTVGLEQTACARSPGLCVLLVDDELMVRESMRLLLEQLGCEVLLAEDQEQAITHAHAQRIDLILSDFRLREGRSGVAVIRAVQALYPQALAALVTGDTAPDRIRDAESAGVSLLYKPLSLAQLMQLLQSSPTASQRASAA